MLLFIDHLLIRDGLICISRISMSLLVIVNCASKSHIQAFHQCFPDLRKNTKMIRTTHKTPCTDGKTVDELGKN